MFARMKEKLSGIVETFVAGYYKPESVLETVEKSTDTAAPLPKAGVGALALAWALTTEVVLSVATAISTLAVAATAGAAALVGFGICATAYRKSEKSCNETIFETNMAGQTVCGTRRDLYRLHCAQQKIVMLSLDFQAVAAPRTVAEEVRHIIAASEEFRHRVRVLSDGEDHAHLAAYEFVRPMIRLSNAEPASLPAAAPRRVTARAGGPHGA